MLGDMASNRVALETVKLLIQVAWADREITIEEVEYVLALAQRAATTAAELEELRRDLATPLRLPAPDLALLRQHRDQVLAAVDQLIGIDNRIVSDERAARDAIAQMLLDQA